MQSKSGWVCVVVAMALLGGCFDLEDHHDVPDGNNGGAEVNQPPNITGAPSSNILEGQFYEFIPNASDPDGDALEFSIARKPSWARFDKASGRVWGTPGAADVGNFTNIAITVSDGTDSANLAAFDISVNAIANGQVTLSWNPPTENSDGTSLTDLAGYRIYYGRDPNQLSQSVVLNNPGLTRYLIENLTPARWHFAMTSVNAEGVESNRTAIASKTIS